MMRLFATCACGLGLRCEHGHPDAGAEHPRRAERRVAEVVAADGDVAALALRRLRGRSLDRRRDLRVVDPHHDGVGAGRAPDGGGVGRRVLDGDGQVTELPGALRVHERPGRRRDRLLRPHVDHRRTVADEDDPAHALRSEERDRPRARLRQIVVLQPCGELLVRRDAFERRQRAGGRVLVHVDRDVLLRGQARVGLPVLVVGDQPEQDDRHRHHGNDHDEDEEEGEAVAEAHPFGATSSYTAGCMWAAGALARYARAGRSSP